MDLTSLLAAESKVAVDVAVDLYDETTGADLNEWLGAYQEYELLSSYVVGGKLVYLDYSDASAYAVIIKDASGSKFVRMVVKEAAELTGNQTVQKISNQLSNLNKVSSLAYQFLTIQDSASELRSQVSGRTDLTGAEKETLNQRIDDYENDRMMFSLTMAVLPAVVAASGGTMAGPALVFNALLGVLNAAAGTFWDYRVGMMTGCEDVDTDFSGTAHGIPLTKSMLREMNYTITDGGTYYLAEPTYSTITIDHASVSLCMHGNGTTVVNNGGLLELCNCMYEEDMDGNKIGNSGFTTVTNEEGEVSVRSGTCSITTSTTTGGDRVEIIGGTVSAITAEGNGVIQVRGGTVSRIVNDSGTLWVRGGRIGRIENGSGIANIVGGQVASSNTVIRNDSGEMTIGSGVLVKKYDSATGTGSVSAAIENGAGGRLTINGATVIGGSNTDHTGAAIQNKQGTLIIKDGYFSCGGEAGDGSCIGNQYGVTEIFDGSFVGGIGNSGMMIDGTRTDGILTIHDGIFQVSDNYNLSNGWGRLTIKDGDFYVKGDRDFYSNLIIRPGNSNAVSETLIQGGTFHCESGDCVKVEALITSSSSVIPSATIEGGDFYSEAGSCVYNTGEMTISNGTFVTGDPPAFQGCVTNADTGSLVISGGTFICLDGAPCVYSDDNQNLTISGGTFLAPEGLSAIEGKGCTLLLGENSAIEMSARFRGLFDEGIRTDAFQLSVETAPGYEGGITYYDSPEGDGISVTAAQVAAMDFSRSSYLRLECDRSLRGTSSDGVSVSASGGGTGSWRATVSAPDGAEIPAGSGIWAASYTDGKMTGVTFGLLEADGTVTFPEPLEEGAVLYFLDGAGRPVCGSIPLQPGKTN